MVKKIDNRTPHCQMWQSKSNQNSKNNTGCSTWSLKKLAAELCASRTQVSMSLLPIKLLCWRSQTEQTERPIAPQVYLSQYWVSFFGFRCLETWKRKDGCTSIPHNMERHIQQEASKYEENTHKWTLLNEEYS